ncbi:non-ribosomal peptide synthetase [Leptolyngbya sp. FACHB-261]|uniref:non-ribosomal peptide synthetase n=1 Tax=Leptolyngbya sp. FACHB-261 TaxID=2692806 RepID=UPI0016887F89|nr:non-ribosomal peptide synthetase [Leptolyngbya sp. FACHB-261]MBD2103128.1 amino acid adenylation domain-containing protein [Leptolyngbya sp. FACHB-261]
MKTVEFLTYLRSLDVQILVEGERLRCNAPEGVLTPQLRAELGARKAEIIAFISNASVDLNATSLSSKVDRRGKNLPLSFAQQRLWFLNQLAPGNAFYNMPAAVRLTGLLNRSALAKTFSEIARRHESLRTTFALQAGQPIQVISDNWNVPLPVIDLQQLPALEQETEVQKLAAADAQRPFDLVQGPLFRAALLQLKATEHVLLLNMHHIVSDGWSFGVLIRELATLYPAFADQQASPLPELPLQYADFACWQRQWLHGEVLDNQLAYWRQQLDNLPALNLPADRPRPAVQSYQGATQAIELSQSLTIALEALSQKAGVTLFMTLLAAFQILLYRYTQQSDVAVGCPIANRNRSEIEGLIGFFVNSLVLRVDLAGNPSFEALLERVREVALGAYAHQDLPFEKLVEELQPERDLSRNPLFQVVFALQNAPMQALKLPGLTLSPIQPQTDTTRFDLELHLWERSEGFNGLWGEDWQGLRGMLVYSTDLFDASTITRLIGHFQTLLLGIVTDPQQRLLDLPLLTATERQQLLVEWNNTQKNYLQNDCVHCLFEAQARRTPEAIAVASQNRSLTYQQLNNQSNQIAHYLQGLGVGPESLVGICMDRSLEMVAVWLGVLKAGGAYVPLDPTHPEKRLNSMLQDAQVAVLLTQDRWAETFAKLLTEPAKQPVKVINLDLDWSMITQQSEANPASSITLDNLAYVIYTSGSTGQPKGVEVCHQGLLNLVSWHQQTFAVSPHDRATQLAGTAFDACAWEIWPYLAAGASIYLPDQETRLSPEKLRDWLLDNAITISFLPTPLAEQMLTLAWPEQAALRTLLTGGDKLHQYPQVRQPFALINNYGPTENTVVTTSGLVPVSEMASANPSLSPSLGHPISNVEVYVLDEQLQPVPIGVPGELCIAGSGLARGYLNRPDLTAERFVPHPFSRSPGARLYRSGDCCCYQPDGSLQFLGRLDQQVKLRGYRIETGELESLLLQNLGEQAGQGAGQGSAVREAAVLLREDQPGQPQLVAYLSLHLDPLNQNQDQSQAQLQQWQQLYEQVYEQAQASPLTPATESEHNFIGWNSSSGETIPLAQMQQWLEDRVERLRQHKLERVLELGCGTGLLLFELAPQSREYWGTDFSQQSLEYVQQRLELRGLEQVKLLNRLAHEFEGIEAGRFDAVILNSVVQYFPSQEYLLEVLSGAVAATAEGGIVFVGDVRSLPLLEAFQSWVQLEQAPASMSREQLQQRVEREVFEEAELLVDPDLFSWLGEQWERVERVEVQLERGWHHNELSQFRYDVLLHIGTPAKASPPADAGPIWQEWAQQQLTLEQVRQQLVQSLPQVAIRGVPNARVLAAVQVATWLASAQGPATAGQMREAVQRLRGQGIEPQVWWDLGKELGYEVQVSWAAGQDGSYDVILVKQGVNPVWPTLVSTALGPQRRYTNNPLQGKLSRAVVRQVQQQLAERVPEYMLPTEWVVLKKLPLNANGKVNRAALPRPESGLTGRAGTAQGPRSELETVLVQLWAEVLGRGQVGIHDNFFALGGHSLLATQLVSRLRDALQVELPLLTLFEAPTIAQLSQEIESLKNSAVISQTPALVPVSREARRMKLSSLQESKHQ